MFSRRTEWKLAPNRLTHAIAEVRASGAGFLDLTISNPTRAGLTHDARQILGALGCEEALDYDPQPQGLRVAREAVAQYYAGRGEAIDPEFLFLTSGTSEAYSYLFRLLANPEDEILIPKPSYPLFDFLAELDDVKLVPYPLIYDHGWQIDWHSLEKAMTAATRAIILVNPNNPTGSYVSTSERARLNELCRGHRLAIVADEVFLDYSLDGEYRPTFAINADALTFTLSGMSKISALPQMKLAWIAVSGPKEVTAMAAQRLEVISDTYLSVSTPIQWAASRLLQEKNNIQPQLTHRLRANLAELDRQLARQQACSRLLLEGGWNVILRVPAVQPDEDLAIQLLHEKKVLVHPGHFYDFPTDGYLVFSLIGEEQEFREGVSRVLEFVSGMSASVG